MTNRFFGRGVGPLPRMLLAGALVAPLAACDTEELLRVDDPTFATPGSLANEAGLPTLVAGAIGDFQVAYSGAGGDSYLSVVSVFTDELVASGSFPTRIATDQREQFPTNQGNTSDGAYSALHRARRSLAEAAAAVQEFRSPNDVDFVRLKALEGFTIVALGEAFCAPIPFSTAVNGAPTDEGQPLSRDETFQFAVKRFDAALAANAASNLAKVGKARALLNLGQYAAAAQAVAGVPTTFFYRIEHSANSGRQNNPIFSLQANGRYSVADSEGTNGLPFRSAEDPRVPWIRPNNKGKPAVGFDGTTPLYIDQRYPDFGSDVPLGGGIEARLVEAEAALNAGNISTFIRILNDLRANVRTLMAARFDQYNTIIQNHPNVAQTLAPLTDPGTRDARVDLLFRERAFWLYTTGHRLGDLRRLVRQYKRPSETVFPTGPYFKGGVFGRDVNFPIPFDEENNSLYSAGSCNTREA